MKSVTETTVRRSEGLTGYRLSVLSRIAAAALGGYALATTLSILLSRMLPVPRAEAVMTGMLISFAVYAGAILWVFATRTASRAWCGLLIPAAACAALWWMIAP